MRRFGASKRKPTSPKRGYDTETGQVYFDVTVPEPCDGQQRTKSRKRPLSLETRAKGGHSRKANRTTGARTLKQMAVREVVSDSRRLTVAHLESLGWSLAKYLWDNLCQSGLDTLRAWILYASAYPRQFAEDQQQSGSERRVRYSEVEDHRSFIPANPSLDWGIVLTCSSNYIPQLQPSLVANLIALELVLPRPGDGDHTLTDQTLRSWSEMAQQGMAFRHLRVLSLWHQSFLTENVFYFFDCFPSLVAISATGYSPLTYPEIRHIAAEFEWKTKFVPGEPDRIFDTVKRLGLDKTDPWVESSSGSYPAALLQVGLPSAPSFPRETSGQMWFTRKQRPKAEDHYHYSRLEVNKTSAAGTRLPQAKRPALRSPSTAHMKKNAAAAQEFLAGLF